MPQPPALPELPIREALPALLEAVARTGTAVLVAPPGTGKTTLAPLALAGLIQGANAPDGTAASRVTRDMPQRRVLVAEPRRLATRAAATRMAAILGEQVGGRVGYQIRGEARRSAATRVEVVTTGVLLNRLIADPELPGVDLVMLDECHERHLETDTAVAFLTETRQILRPELGLVAASATADVGLWTALIGTEHAPAPSVSSEPMRYPVEMHWAPPRERVSAPDGMRVDPRFLAHVAHTVERAVDTDDGDLLVFLPGAAEIRRVAERLAHLTSENLGVDIYQLHGSVSSADQDRALSATLASRESAERIGERRRIILATDIAESSLTVPGVRIVVDAGLARRPLVDHARGLPGLTTAYASRAAADQRAGRAGREGPGAVWRCWSEAEHTRRAAQPAPDIACSDLTAFRLQAACWGTPVEELAMPGPPPTGALEAAEATLRALGAIDTDGIATPRGRHLARMGVPPRLARALVDGADRIGAAKAAEVAALLNLDRRARGDDLLAQWRQLRASRDRQWESEVKRLKRALSSAREERNTASSTTNGEPDAAAKAGGTDTAASDGPTARAHRAASRSGERRSAVGDDEAAATVIALAFPERVAKHQGGVALTPIRGRGADANRMGAPTSAGQWRTVAGTGAVAAEGSSLVGSPWLAIADADRSPGRAAALIRAAVPIDGELACELVGDSVSERVEWDGERRDVAARRVRSLGAIEVSAEPLRRADPALVAAALAEGLRREGLGLLRWSEESKRLRERMAFCRRALGEPWADVSDAALTAGTDWLEPWWSRAGRRADVERIPVGQALRNLLPWRAGIDETAPESLTVPTGREARVDYSGEAPVLAVKLQEMFGAVDTPRVAGVPVVLHLLSPAGRPLAVTADLRSFWEGPYRDVRKEMRGRYPKHPWPEDPYSVAPTAKTKRHLR
ncbi:ATP-dependent RNA helicase [Glycomyces sp. YM15]|uniref:ATP-dependent RNA helicase n=1 Tax=Glycomyces sp. YM15 TaxID=2800446 RepID=UPI001962A6E7|nr:ATP-dependent helicase C-terminal domain-containing protein [Glycomyces sp. YM15]